jgi:hypothetical protein
MAGQVWVNASEGGHLTNNRLSKSLRAQNLPEYVYRQFVDIKEALGRKSGDTVYFDKTLKIDTKGDTLIETNTMPENRWKVVKDSVVVTEHGNSVPYTEKLQVLAEFDPQNISTVTLKNDQLEVLDSKVAAKFDDCRFRAVCTATNATTFTSDGAQTATAAVNMSDKNVRDVVDFMEKKHIPVFSDGNFRAINSVNTRRGIYDYLEAIAQYTDPKYKHNKEIGQYYNVRFQLDNSYLSNSVGASSVNGTAFFFGKESVLEAVAMMEEVRMKIPTDYGRSKGVAWIANLGFAKMWKLDTDDLNSVGKGIERIVKVTSHNDT